MSRRAADEPLVDFTALQQWAGHALRSASRRWLLCLMLLVLCVAAAVGGGLMKPVLYSADARVLATPVDGAPGTMSATAGAAAGLSPSAVDGLVSDESLRALVRELHLVERFEQTRTPLLRMKDSLREKLTGQMTEADREDALVGVLRDWVYVKVAGQAVELGATFPERNTARDIVEQLRVRLIEARRTAELASLEATAKAQRARVTDANERVQQSVAALDAHLGKKRKGSKPSTVRGVQQEGSWGALPDARLMDLRTRILATRKAVAELETSRSKRLAELNAVLVEQQSTLGEQHPSLIETREKLSALQGPGPELLALREREASLVREFVLGGGRDTELSELPTPMFSPEVLAEDSTAQWLRSKVALESAQLENAYRDDSLATVALAAATAQFPERYATLKAPLSGRDPISAPLWKFILFGLVAGCALALTAAVLLETHEAKVRAAWQLERALDLPVLGTIPLRTGGSRAGT